MTDPKRSVAALAAGWTLAAAALGACGGGAAPAPSALPSSMGNSTNLAVPTSVADLPLVDQRDSPTDLAAFHGRVLVLAQFLTSCQEECPLVTGAFLTIQHDLDAAGLGGQVALAEMTVDPDRDTSPRLAAYAAYTGASWTLLTSTAPNTDAFWHHFGIYYEKVAEDSPPGIDWETGKPYTYDVNHSNGFLVFDTAGHLRFATGNLPNLHGQLSQPLRKLLSSNGVGNLDHPDPNQTWTVPQALQAIGAVLGRAVPAAG